MPRIISLLPSGTELVCALGLRDSLVGVSHECDFPHGVGGLPCVTSSIVESGLTPAQIDAAVLAASLEQRPLYSVDVDLLADLQPDLIVTQGVCAVCAVTEETVRTNLSFCALEDAISAPIVSLTGHDWAGIRSDLEELADAVGHRERAITLLGELDRRWDRLAASVPAHRPTLAMLEWPDPPWFGGHWVPEQVAVAGGIDLFGTAGAPSGRLTWRQCLEAEPDYVIGMACGYDLQQNLTHFAAAVAGPLADLRAVQAGRVWAVDANAFFSRPGPRVVDGAELLRRILTGQMVLPERAMCLRGLGREAHGPSTVLACP